MYVCTLDVHIDFMLNNLSPPSFTSFRYLESFLAIPYKYFSLSFSSLICVVDGGGGGDVAKCSVIKYSKLLHNTAVLPLFLGLSLIKNVLVAPAATI